MNNVSGFNKISIILFIIFIGILGVIVYKKVNLFKNEKFIKSASILFFYLLGVLLFTLSDQGFREATSTIHLFFVLCLSTLSLYVFFILIDFIKNNILKKIIYALIFIFFTVIFLSKSVKHYEFISDYVKINNEIVEIIQKNKNFSKGYYLVVKIPKSYNDKWQLRCLIEEEQWCAKMMINYYESNIDLKFEVSDNDLIEYKMIKIKK